jgi:hypothetical protein
MIPRWFNENICIANYDESGERTTSFIAEKRLDKVLSMVKEGNYIFAEFAIMMKEIMVRMLEYF